MICLQYINLNINVMVYEVKLYIILMFKRCIKVILPDTMLVITSNR
jgi:hypothetical protein